MLCCILLLPLCSVNLHLEPVDDFVPLCLWNLIVLGHCERCFQIAINRSIWLTRSLVQLVDKGLYLLLVFRGKRCWWQPVQNVRNNCLEALQPGLDTPAPVLNIALPL